MLTNPIGYTETPSNYQRYLGLLWLPLLPLYPL